MPTSFAYLTLIIWPIISLVLFTRLSALQATFWTIFGGYMLLPVTFVSFDYPLIPALNKETIPALTALVGCLFIAKEKVPLLPRPALEKTLFIVLLVTPLATVVTNMEPLGLIPGMRLYDAFSFIASTYIALLPFLLGMHLVKTYDDQLNFFRWLVIAGLAYSLLALIEIRLSPQLHNWLYGFFPHLWLQQVRFGGFRPVVFMGHGLLVAIFFAVSLMSAILLWKEKQGLIANNANSAKFTLVAIIYLLVMLILCKSVGAMMFGAAFLIVVGFLHIKMVRMATLFVMVVVIAYPFLSITGLFPHDSLVQLAENFSADRAESLQFRFINENLLLAHAQEKFLFGWGTWGRNRPIASVITDGYWIIVLGTIGIVGFLATFGLVGVVIFKGLKAGKFLPANRGKQLMVGNTLLIAILMVDQVLNDSTGAWLWLIIGALAGRAAAVASEGHTDST